jgi:hypothetical protein
LSIPDPKTATKEKGEKNLLSYLFCSHKYYKIKNYFEQVKKKFWANLQRIIELFTQKIGIKLLKIWAWDPWFKRAPDPGYLSLNFFSLKF